ncbi:hypothetical protein MNBD_ALPHA08-2343 [hydrothermal vent metagenome]|uniref:Uncharacterized protein n=1 Tax=hydrothermal vent metagenome TaxID=652676 RepID=A0A3B0S4U7_9ZZZZ
MSETDLLANAHWHLADQKQASFKQSQYENGMPMIRMTVKEGTRITLFDIHPQAAKEMGEMMVKWAEKNMQQDK